MSGEHATSLSAVLMENPDAPREERARHRVTYRRGRKTPTGLDVTGSGGIERSITMNTLKARVLCKDHNTRLRVVDDVAKPFTQALQAFSRPLEDGLFELEVDGRLLERWFLKKAIADVVAQRARLPIGENGGELDTPSSALVEATFGMREMDRSVGAYRVVGTHQELLADIFESGTWLWKDGDGIRTGGSYSVYLGFRFAVNLDPNIELPSRWPTLSELPGWTGTTVHRPFPDLVHPDTKNVVRFRW